MGTALQHGNARAIIACTRAANSTERWCADLLRAALRGRHTADELRRFQDQQVAGQKTQQLLGGVADQRTLESRTRMRRNPCETDSREKGCARSCAAGG